jgi:hypothetical protein
MTRLNSVNSLLTNDMRIDEGRDDRREITVESPFPPRGLMPPASAAETSTVALAANGN